MLDGRRHSVDIPLSKTLVALKRVRSLRDPDTNSLSKFTAHLESLNWDTVSCNGALLELTSADRHGVVPYTTHLLRGEREDHGSISDSDHSLNAGNPKVTLSKKSSVVKTRDSKATRTKLVHESSPDHACKSVESKRVPHSIDLLKEEEDSYSEPNLKSTDRFNEIAVRKRSGCSGRRRPSAVLEDASMSRVGSPSMSVNELRANYLRRSDLGLAAEEVDIVDSNNSGCGLSYCWSRTPKYTDSNLPSDTEDQEHPLLSFETREVAHAEASSYAETPRSLSQKFRPRTFSELVGQNVVTQSLLNAISKGRIAPLYLFHGPRGTGKTSTARIFASALNCLSLEEQRPCGICQQCVYFFSARSRDVKELDATKINRKDSVKALLKSASLVPLSSRYKVYIIDACECLLGETWTVILNRLEELSRHTVFVMVTCDVDKLPKSFVSRCQRYHFSKIQDADIVFRLQKLCVEERLNFDVDALDFIAAKSNGSLRDAETMLDQLGLLGKKITLSLAAELVGVVSDDELLDLLDLALSSDTTNTVKKARELMGSRVDPMQLVSQLANLIVDILAGRSRLSEVVAEAGMEKLRHVLNILSETEKQLRTSKNQTTWLTVALLQFNSRESLCSRTSDLKDGGLGTNSSRESLRSYVCYVCNHNMSNCSGRYCDSTKLEIIWRKATEKCKSISLRNFLQKEGYLSSIYIAQGMAVAEVEFCHPDYVSRAETSWSIIASSLQHVLGYNVEIRFNLVPTCPRKTSKLKRPSFSLLTCSGRNQELSDSTSSNESDNQTCTTRTRFVKACPAHCSQQLSPFSQDFGPITTGNATCLHCDEAAVTTRNIEADARSSGTTISKRSVHEFTNGCKLKTDLFNEVGEKDHRCMNIQEPEVQPCCFAKALKLQRKFPSSDVAHTICMRIQPHKKLELSVPKSTLPDACACTNDPHVFCSRSNAPYSSGDDSRPSKYSRFSSKFLCWRAFKCSNKRA